MKKLFLLLFCFSLATTVIANEKKLGMTPELLIKSIQLYAENVEVEKNLVSFLFEDIPLFCVWDINANRMRILSPIAKANEVPPGSLIKALQANYHTALDARYAIGDDMLYSAFIHPLSPLTQDELFSAIRQVATAAATYGDQFSSGELVFPSSKPAKKKSTASKIY